MGDTELLIQHKIRTVLEIYPKISPSMLQIAIGSPPAKLWKPELAKMIEAGIVTTYTMVHLSAAGRPTSYTIISLNDSGYPKVSGRIVQHGTNMQQVSR